MITELCFSNSGNNDCWIGLNDIDVEEDFQWANGTAYPADGYTFNVGWNRASRDCFFLVGWYHNGSIEGQACSHTKKFLCENPPNTYSSSRSSSDYVSQDLDSQSRGPETITVSAVRSGTYRYYVHNYTNAGQQNHMGLYKSKASVKVYHSSLSGGFKQFKAPNMAGNLWTVFEFNNSSGVTRIRTVGSESLSANVDNHGSSLDTTGPTVTSVSTTADNQSAVSITDNITVTFSEAMDYTSITTNIDNSSCYGTLMVSSDNFSNCVQMASPNKALDFDGTNDYVAVSNPSSIPVGIESYTIEAWFYADQMGTRGIVGWGNYGSYNQVTALRLHGSNGFRHYWWANDLDVTTGDISGAWHHIAATWDGTNRKLYLDGVFKKGDQPSGHAVPNASNFRIGSTNNGEYFDGKIDEIRI